MDCKVNFEAAGNVPRFSVGDTVSFLSEFSGVICGNYRGEIDGKACVVVNGQNWFLETAKLTRGGCRK